jgi:general secretion pathway protein G
MNSNFKVINHQRRSRQRRGVTLVEVLIVVAIMSLLSAGVALAVIPAWMRARIETTRMSATELRKAALNWQAQTASAECPTPTVLYQARVVDSVSKLADAWDTPFKIACEEDDVRVYSAGPDRKRDTDDDIVVPPRARRAESN